LDSTFETGGKLLQVAKVASEPDCGRGAGLRIFKCGFPDFYDNISRSSWGLEMPVPGFVVEVCRVVFFQSSFPEF